METAILLGDRDIVDAGFAAAHQAVLVEFPLLVAVGPIPLSGAVMPFVLKAYRDAVLIEPPEVLDQAIVVLLGPFALEKGNDRRPALENFRAVTPAAVLGIGPRYALWIAGIPGVFRHARLLRGGLAGKRRQWWTRHNDLPGFFGLGARLPQESRVSRAVCSRRIAIPIGRLPMQIDNATWPYSRSAFSSARNDFGIGCALPSLMNATRTSAFT